MTSRLVPLWVKGLIALIAVVSITAVVVACSGSRPACAASTSMVLVQGPAPAVLPMATTKPIKPASTGRAVPTPPRTTTGTNPTSGTGTKPTTGSTGNTGVNPTRPAMPKVVPTPPSSGTKRTVPGEDAYTPPVNGPQPQADIDAVRAQAPPRFSMSASQGYLSPVTHHRYVYHDSYYFATLGWHDLYDPYDPFNWTYILSPWYGYRPMIVAHC